MFSSSVRSAGFEKKSCARRRGGAKLLHGLRPVVQLEGRLVPATFAVTNLSDSGTGSLRQAIQNANAMSGPDTITFFPNVLGTITLTSGELLISGAVSILGPGADKLTVSGNFASRIFKINTQGSKSAVGIAGLTIANGFSDLNGGGIRSKDAALTLVDCVVTGNTSFIDGGGIFVYSATGSLVVRRCSITNNSAPYGGGIDFFQGGGGSLVIEDTTMSGNSATGEPGFNIDGSGGAVYFSGTVGSGGLIIRNSTISGNTATGSGAGVCVASLVGNLVVQNSTITGNINYNGTGAGIARLSGTGNIVLESTIVSGNSSPSALDLFTTGTLSATRCLIGSPMGVTNSMVDVVTNGLFGVDPQLGPLTNNGGLGETHALTEDSPCIDVGSNPANMGYDQRGSGYLRTVGAAPDIGAFEYQTPPSPPGFTGEPISINGGTGQRSMVNQVTINFSQIVNLPANPAAAFELKRQSDGATVGLVAGKFTI